MALHVSAFTLPSYTVGAASIRQLETMKTMSAAPSGSLPPLANHGIVPPAGNNTKLFVGGLSYATTDESLLQYFSQFGQVLSAVVLRDQDGNRSRGFGFVTFARPESAISAIGHHHHVVDGRKVESKFAVPKRRTDSGGDGDMAELGQIPVNQMNTSRSVPLSSTMGISRTTPTPTSTRSSPTMFSPNTTATSTTTAGLSGDSGSPIPSGDIIPNKIFVGGLRYATTPESLRNYFEEFGEVETAQIIFNRDTRKSRGFGYVVFREPSSVDKVISRQRSNPPVIEGKQVEVKNCFARQEQSGTLSATSSPRAVPQTPIATRSDSFSSLTSSNSMQLPRAGVSATPVRPPSAAVFNPPHTAAYQQMQQPQMMSRDQWGSLSSPVTFELTEGVPMQADRRASFTSSSVRSSSPFASVPPGQGHESMDQHAHMHFKPVSPFPSPGYARESPSLPYSASRFQHYQGGAGLPIGPPIQSQLRAREDSVFSTESMGQMMGGGQQMPMQPKPSAFVPRDNNPDTGLFDMTHFLVSSVLHTGGSQQQQHHQQHPQQQQQQQQFQTVPVRRPVSEAPPSLGAPGNPLFRPVLQPPMQNPSSPARGSVARSPLLDQQALNGAAVSFSPFPTSSSNRSIW